VRARTRAYAPLHWARTSPGELTSVCDHAKDEAWSPS